MLVEKLKYQFKRSEHMVNLYSWTYFTVVWYSFGNTYEVCQMIPTDTTSCRE